MFIRWVFAFCLGAAVFATELNAQTSPVSLGVNRTQTVNPYYFVGRVNTKFGASSYIGSGTVIASRSVITCGHVVWKAGLGWATNVYFQRGLYNSSVLKTIYASRKVLLGGYTSAVNTYGVRSSQSYSYDLAALNFVADPANGASAGWWANTTLLTGTSYNMSLGYGGVIHNGRELLRSAPSESFYQRHGGYYFNDSYLIESGMSGGPVFAKSGATWYVCGVNVSGNETGSGIRAFDTTADRFIRSNLY